ncbi:MAG: LysR family transcriptional regulator, partial [Myxococcota bacterium]
MNTHISPSLGAFMSTAEHGSFAAAARHLGVSAAAVGQHIKRLEAQYRIKLFNRTTRSMRLTPEGRLLYERAREPIRELDEIDALFDESRGRVSGLLRVSAPSLIAAQTVVPLMAKFRELYPAVEFDLDSSDQVRDFVRDPVDLAFRLAEVPDASYVARRLSRLDILTLASPAYLQRAGTPSHPQDLQDHTCLRYRFPSGGVWTWIFSVAGETVRYESKDRALLFNGPEALIAAAEAGLGMVQLDTYYARNSVQSGRLVPVMTGMNPSANGLFLCYRSRRSLPLRTRRFIDFTLEHVPEDAFLEAPDVYPASVTRGDGSRSKVLDS